ncbi:hypothetical protein ACTWWB_000633 [Vibrio fluvialis]
MQISELLHLREWFLTKVVNAEIIQKYSGLHEVLQHNINVQTAPANQRQRSPLKPYESELSALSEALKAIDFSALTLAQENVLENLKIKNIIGVEGSNKINEVALNSLDIVSFNKYCTDSVTLLNAANSKLTELYKHITSIFTDEEFEADFDSNKEVMLRLHFQGNSSINDVNLFNAWGKQWKFIIDHTGEPFNVSAQDVRVVGASKGSVILELIVEATPYALVFASLVNWSLDTISKVYAIKQQRVDIESSQLDNKAKKKIIDILDSEEMNYKNESIDNKVKEIIDNLPNGPDSINGDTESKMRSAVKKLLNFIEGGGSIDIVADNKNSDESGEDISDSIMQLKKSFEDARVIEDKLKALGYRKNDVGPEFED